MDRMVYVAMTGAKHTLEQQAATAANLANATTTGFRAQLNSFRAIPVIGTAAPTRTFVVDSTVGTDFKPAPLQHTGRDLDIAVQGTGWIAVQLPDGSEAYTRNGNLQISTNGALQTATGLNLLGDSGPIAIPPNSEIAIGKDGTVSATALGVQPLIATPVGRIKLVNPTAANLVRGDDGLFRLQDGKPADADAGVTVAGGTLEGSNVNVAEAMVSMISLARQFDLQVKLIQNADNNAQKASQLLAVG